MPISPTFELFLPLFVNKKIKQLHFYQETVTEVKR